MVCALCIGQMTCTEGNKKQRPIDGVTGLTLSHHLQQIAPQSFVSARLSDSEQRTFGCLNSGGVAQVIQF